MDDMLDSNGSCMYCSKYLNNLNEFNKRMHRDTCKVRKLVESGNFQNANLASLAMAGGQASSQDGVFSGSSTGGGGSSGSSSSSASSSSPSTAAAAGGAGDQSANTAGSDDYIVIGENCAYCYKTFKDFKSDFNKLVHIKCCKKKREDYEKKALLAQNRAAAAAAAVAANSTGNPLAAAAAAAAALNLQSYQTASPMGSSANIFGPNTSVLSSSTPQTSMGGGEACLFCNKPLANLNEFNKKMHVENCKIRKSIEGNMTPKSSRKNADDSLNKLGMELGDQCMYCCRSFANLSNFNKKLHFDHCKTKKRKLKHGSSPNNNSSQSFNQSTGSVDPNGDGSIVNLSTHSMNSSSASLINHALNFSQQHLQQQTPNHHQQQQQHHQQQQQQQHHAKSAGNNNPNNLIDLGDNCLFCSRSLANLSNFNKKVHIETCKIKQLKKETANRLRQVNKSVKKRSPKQQQNNPNNTNNTSNNTQNNNNNNKDIKQNMNNLMMNNMDVNNDGNTSTNSHLQMSQYDQLTTSLNLSGLDQSVAAIHHHHQQLQQQQQQQQQNSQNLLNPTGHLQLPMDPNVVGSVASRLFI